ncbi:hypothetical protein G6F46_014487 [Rhizopus delemar]|uniref:Reverse transcriptase domain-containing protein n=2 Tax=Rhizopus TaxID=4842 RepID=A0A9P7C1P0_9FUNG|nr:hypothetical protein G6F55_013945 [Rhizopus delemar]KAG1529295.1 hypothetical protein G6F51_014194 [Rhizopus arrhizus]KAG1479966.1 hypothetical protein G6F54_013857 [Rhizopus delemar]KAG1486946.1 hypothetical protein G6F53_013856 [Rhizopus delemar]KAG1488940.1 hypothetical protein G6F52_013788 [Rhizopus delemar]
MAYADNIAIFLVDPSELHALLDVLDLYSRAFNARLNRQKNLGNFTIYTTAAPMAIRPVFSWYNTVA